MFLKALNIPALWGVPSLFVPVYTQPRGLGVYIKFLRVQGRDSRPHSEINGIDSKTLQLHISSCVYICGCMFVCVFF